MKMPDQIPQIMIAPCGVDCMVCYAHLRNTKPCPGCLTASDPKPNHCKTCRFKDCALEQGLPACFQCSRFPCVALKRLDKRYRQRYQVSLIDNGVRLKAVGPEQYLREERALWLCPACGGAISLHDRICSKCGMAKG